MAKLQAVRDDAGELERLIQRHNAAIKRGFDAFVEAGTSLREMRDGFSDGRFADSGFSSFAGFAKAELGYTLGRVSQLINGAQTAQRLYHGKLPAPENERQIRELLRLKDDPKAQDSAWADACKTAKSTGEPVTARLVREMVKQRLPEKEEPEEPEDAPIDTDGETVDDECVFDAGARLSAIVDAVQATIEDWPEDMSMDSLTAMLQGQLAYAREIAAERSTQ